MGPDQGKTSNLIGLALLAEATGRSIPEVGTTTFRPPYTPVTMGAFPGQESAAHVEPTRYSAMHDWHVEHGAGFVNAGLWKRPHSYPRAGETPDDAANAAVPCLAVGEGHVRAAHGAVPARVLRMSYSGELAYEIHVPADRGRAMWEAVIAAGAPFGLMPCGTEAMATLRIEKGHIVVGAEADGRTTADDLGLSNLVNAGKWCIGKRLLDRPALKTPDRWQLVGLTALDGAAIPRGAKLVADPDGAPPSPMLGHVTSWCWSPHLDAWIALGLLARGRERHGEVLWAVSPLADTKVRVKIGSACFIDPRGGRLRV